MTLIEVERCIKKWHKELPGWNAKIKYEAWDRGDGLKKYYFPVFHREKFYIHKPIGLTMWYALYATHGQCIEAKGRTPIQALNNLKKLLTHVQQEISQTLRNLGVL